MKPEQRRRAWYATHLDDVCLLEETPAWKQWIPGLLIGLVCFLGFAVLLVVIL